MDIMNILSFFTGIGLFLYGIDAMGQGLEYAAGSKMKKILVIALAVVMLVSVFALTACNQQTVEGEYKYENPYAAGKYYGVKVSVTLNKDVITKVVVTSEDTDAYTNLSASWTDKSKWENGEVYPELDKLMESRRNYLYQPGQALLRATEGSDKYHLGVAAPILCQGDLMGCVMLLMGDDRTPLQESDQKLAQTVAGFLGKQMEN